MYLLIYVCCKESDRQHALEQSVRTEWVEQLPAIADLVSMGRQKRWHIVELVAYKPVVLEPVMLGQDVHAVYLAQVHREDLPLAPRAEWSFCHPQESVHVHLANVDTPALQLGFNALGEPPHIGARLTLDQSESDPSEAIGTQLTQPELTQPELTQTKRTQWVIDRYDTYLPESHASYHAIYLAWCLVPERLIAG